MYVSIAMLVIVYDVVTIRVTEKSPAMKILYEKDLMVYQEYPPESV